MLRGIQVAAAAAAVGMATGHAAAVTPVEAVVGPSGRTYDPFSLAAGTGAGRSAVVGWTVQSPRDQVQVAVRGRTSARFGRPVTVGLGRVSRVATDPAGRAPTVAWLDGGRLRVAVRDGRGRWSAQRLPGSVATGAGLRVTDLRVRGRGEVTLVLEDRDAGVWRVQVLERTRTGRWRASAPLAAGDAAGGEASADARGTVTAVWLAVGDGGTELRAATRAAGGGWGRAEVIARPPVRATLTEPQVAVSARGDVVVLAGAETEDGDDLSSRVVWRSPGRGWRTSRPATAVDMSVGSGGAVWVARRAGARIAAARLAADGTWSRTETVTRSGAGLVGGPGTLVLPGGAPMVWWVVDGRPATRDRWYAADRAGRTWSAARRVAATDGAVEFASGPGTALAAYVSPAGGGRVVAVDLRVSR